MRLLFVEDNPADVELTVAELQRFGFEVSYERVETLDGLLHALENGSWSAIISDYALSGFDGRQVLDLVRERDREIPFIVVSGFLGEERAVDVIRAGANDFVSKDRLARLGPALERELRDVQLREERRSLFTALRRSEDRYRRIIDHAPVGIAVSTPDGTILTANDRLTAIAGLRREEIVGRRISEFAGDRRPLPGDPDRSERRFVRADGQVVWTAISVSPVTNDTHQVEQLVWLVEDITAQKLRDAELRSHQEQLEQAQRMANMGSYEVDLATGRRAASPELFRIWGLEPRMTHDPELLDSRIHPDDLTHVQRSRRLVFEGDQPFDDEYRVLRPDGQVRVIHERGHFVTDAHGRATKLVGIVQDVTETRRQEDELQRRSVQQVVVANLGQAALSGEPMDALIAEASDLATRLLGVDSSIVMRKVENGFRIVGGTGWEEIAPVGLEVEGSVASQSTYTIACGAPVTVNDLRTETRFTPSPFLLSQGVISTIAVPINTARTPAWGVITALAFTPRRFSTSDVEFLRSMATVLAQALERDRVDQQLVLHAAQQSAIAELSRVALKSVDDAIEIACNVVSDVLEVEHALFFELDESANMLRYRAGRCWAPAAEMDVPLTSSSAVAEAVLFDRPAMLKDEGAGLAAGVAIPVASTTAKIGALTAFTTRPRKLLETDVEFLESVANILADAVERERSARALAASEERNREVIEGASEIIFTLSTEGVFTSLNAAFTNITGLPAADWIGRSFTELTYPDDVAPTVELFEKILWKQESITAEVRVAGRTGIVVLELTAFPKVEHGRTAAVYGFARDITETRRVERERQRLTRNLQLLLESTVEGIVTVDLAGHCTMSNRAAAQMLGRDRDEMIGATLQTLVNAADAATVAQIVAVARSGEVRTISDGTFHRADGTPFPVEYSAAPIVDAGLRIGVVISFSDVTERRKLEAKLEQANRLGSLGRLAATIAHEFNNVLMGISPFVEVIRRGRNVEGSLDHISRAVQRGKRITQDILRFTQPAQPVRAPIEAGPWLDNVTIEARSLMPGCLVMTSVDRGLRIDGDATQLQQIFTNLILNARDAMPSGGTLTLEVRREPAGARLPFAIERPERFAHIIVRDTGTGMSAETQQHIFEPLFTTKKNGTGLGLPVTHQVVQRHGGEVFVESALGEGTTFHIFLPLTEAPDVRPAEPAMQSDAANGTHRVLLVEDDVNVAAGLVTLLEMQGLHVDLAVSGQEAIRRVDELEPDVVVLDVGLPDMDGTSVYQQIAQRHPKMAVVFSTGHADRGKLDTLLERPHAAFLLKPYESSALLAAIHDVLQ
jgi:PAS domain S-box-containing protein